MTTPSPEDEIDAVKSTIPTTTKRAGSATVGATVVSVTGITFPISAKKNASEVKG